MSLWNRGNREAGAGAPAASAAIPPPQGAARVERREAVAPGAATSLQDLLLSEGKVSAAQLEQALKKQRDSGEFIGEILIREGVLEEKSLISFIAKHCKVPHLSLLDYLIDETLLQLLPAELCLKHRVLPIDRLGRNLTVAMVNPLDQEALEALRQCCPDLRIKPILCAYQHFEVVASRLLSADRKSGPVEMGMSSFGLKRVPGHVPAAAPPAPEAQPVVEEMAVPAELNLSADVERVDGTPPHPKPASPEPGHDASLGLLTSRPLTLTLSPEAGAREPDQTLSSLSYAQDTVVPAQDSIDLPEADYALEKLASPAELSPDGIEEAPLPVEELPEPEVEHLVAEELAAADIQVDAYEADGSEDATEEAADAPVPVEAPVALVPTRAETADDLPLEEDIPDAIPIEEDVDQATVISAVFNSEPESHPVPETVAPESTVIPEGPPSAPQVMQDVAAVLLNSMRYTYTMLARRVDLFQGLSGEEVATLFAHGATVETSADDIIFRKGDPPDKLYVILGGTVEIEDDGHRIATLGQGDMFGEMALMSAAPRSATARASASTSLLALDKSSLQSDLSRETSTQLLVNIIITLSERLRMANEQLH